MLNLTLSDGSPFNLGIDYWKKRLKGVKPMNLFGAPAKRDIQSSNKDEKINKQLSQFNKQQKVTLFVTLLSLEFPDELLSRYTSKSNLTFILKEELSDLQGTVEYSTDLYREDTIVQIIDHYKLLLNDR